MANTTEGTSPTAKGSRYFPCYLRDDFVEGPSLLIPSPFKFGPNLSEVDTAQQNGGEEFKFKPHQTPSTSPEPQGFHFSARHPSTSTINTVSLRSWNHERSHSLGSHEERNTLLSTNDSFAFTTADSFVFDITPDPRVHIKTKSEAHEICNSPVSSKDLRSQSMPASPVRSRFFNWRWRKKPFSKSTQEGGRSGTPPGLTSIEETTRIESTDLTESNHCNHLTEASEQVRSDSLQVDLTDLLQPTPEFTFPVTPKIESKGHPPKGNPNYSCRWALFARRGKNVPRVVFHPSDLGGGFRLDSWSFKTVSDFNGYWKMDSGGKELHKAQASHPGWKKIISKCDGGIRFMLLDSSISHFRVVKWSAMAQHQEQRPWNGEEATVMKGGGKKAELKLSVQINENTIEAHSKLASGGGCIREVYSLSPDRLKLTIAVTLEQRYTGFRTHPLTTSMVHNVSFSRI